MPFRVKILAVGAEPMLEVTYLKAFDHEAHGGSGEGVHTFNPDDAMTFPDMLEAMEFWKRVPECRPLRLDGQPNRPLSAATIELEFVP